MIFIDPESIDHILQRLKERSSDENTISWLRHILRVMNDYIPDDWRFGKRSDEFIIRTLGKSDITLVGSTLKSSKKENHFIHIVQTILPKGGFSKGERFADGADAGRVVAQRPNLYVLELFENEVHGLIKNAWLYPISPIAARQYEKVNPYQRNTPTYEYHKINPLTKNGIVTDVHGWIKWNINGSVEWGPRIQPESDWRGENYWNMKKTINEDREHSLYIENLNQLR